MLSVDMKNRRGGILTKYISWTKERIEGLVNLWNQELNESFPMSRKLFEQNSFQDENICYRASRIAVDSDDKVIGFIVAKKWQEQLSVEMRKETGWIQVLLVNHTYRNQGIGDELLRHAESTLKSAGMREVLLGKDPWHYYPGIPQQFNDVARWFEGKGYEAYGEEYDLINHYDGHKKNSLPTVDNAMFSILDPKDKEDFLDFLHRCFPGRWEYEALHYFQKGGTGREFVVLKKNDKIIGFSRINDAKSPFIAQNVYWAPLFDKELGGIGPLGIDANERKQGYGVAVVEAAITFLRGRDINNIVIDWTGLVDFYKKMGYDVWKGYYSYKKNL